jgi:hypothetical protein
MPKETIPRLAFERMFGSGDSAKRRERDLVRKSILDVVGAEADQLQRRVGLNDRRKLDEYFSSVREIEKRIERSEHEDAQAMPDIQVPHGRIDSFREHARLMYDLLVVAFRTDTTRVATFMLDNAGGRRRYTEVGATDAHHSLSHHRDRRETIEQLQKIDHYLVEQFAYFLGQLDATKDAGGSLLDQSMILYGSGLSDANRHDHHNLPIVLAGGAAGKLKTDRHLVTKSERPMGNLFLSMLDIMGTPAESIGDSSGRLNELA